MTAAALTRHRFRSMGVWVEVLTSAPPEQVSEVMEQVEAEFSRLEGVFSRFDPQSELSRLNRAGAAEVGDDLLSLAAYALAARGASNGLVDVTVHDALVAWGYDRTYGELADDDRPAPAELPSCGGAFTVDDRRCVVALAPATRLDFGGLAKGFAVDQALALLEGIGPRVVNAGGDLAVVADDAAPWPVGVDTPEGGLTLELSSGALATSGRDARRWRVAGGEAHHLIDPRTGRPAASDLVRATAWAPTALEAEVAAKELFLLGAAGARARADEAGIPAVLAVEDGATIRAGGLA